MRDLGRVVVGLALAISLAISLAIVPAGCSSSYGTFSTARLSPPLASANVTRRSNVRTPLVYVADHTNNLIDVFDMRGALQYTITSGLNAPAGLFVDAAHDLWVTNSGASNVLVFHRGAMTPSETLHDSNQPNDVAICGDGTAFVADSSSGVGVGVYPPGHTHATRHLAAKQSVQGSNEFYVTCDSAVNIFATGLIGASPFIATTGWRHARESGYYLLKQGAWSISGIKATAAGTLLIATGGHSHGVVEEFTQTGRPTGRAIHTGSDVWSDIALNAQQNVVFGADTMRGVVVARKFPGGSVERTYSNANLVQPQGVAIDPGD